MKTAIVPLLLVLSTGLAAAETPADLPSAFAQAAKKVENLAQGAFDGAAYRVIDGRLVRSINSTEKSCVLAPDVETFEVNALYAAFGNACNYSVFYLKKANGGNDLYALVGYSRQESYSKDPCVAYSILVARGVKALKRVVESSKHGGNFSSLIDIEYAPGMTPPGTFDVDQRIEEQTRLLAGRLDAAAK